MRRSTFIKSLIFFGAAAILPPIPISYPDKGKITKIGTIEIQKNGKWSFQNWGFAEFKEGMRVGPEGLIHIAGYSPEELLQISIQHKNV